MSKKTVAAGPIPPARRGTGLRWKDDGGCLIIDHRRTIIGPAENSL